MSGILRISAKLRHLRVGTNKGQSVFFEEN